MPPAAAVELLDDVLSRIVLGLGVPVIAIAGNHDSPERLSFGSRLLREAGLHLCGDLGRAFEPIILRDAHGPVAIHPVPFLEPAVVRHRLEDPDLAGIEAATAAVLDRIRACRAGGTRRVVVAHGFVTGMAESESERPLSPSGERPGHEPDSWYTAEISGPRLDGNEEGNHEGICRDRHRIDLPGRARRRVR